MAKKAKSKTRKSRPRPRRKNKRLERNLEEGLRETFPASDAVAVTDPVRTIKE
jgi:ribosomal protein S2